MRELIAYYVPNIYEDRPDDKTSGCLPDFPMSTLNKWRLRSR